MLFKYFQISMSTCLTIKQPGRYIKILHNEATIRAIYNKISLNKIKKSPVTFLMAKMIMIFFGILIMGVFTLKIMKNGRKKRCLHCLNF